MPIEVKYLDAGKGVVLTASGIVTGEDFIEASNEIFSRDLAAEPYLYAVVDFDGSNGTNISTSQLREIANRDLLASRYLPKGVVGIYANNDLPFALARIWQILVESSGWETRIFRSRPEAVSWVKQRVVDKFGVRASLEQYSATEAVQ